jgi:hypothetical protein
MLIVQEHGAQLHRFLGQQAGKTGNMKPLCYYDVNLCRGDPSSDGCYDK